MKPLRIAMVSYYLPSESKIGVGYWAHAFANALVRRGHHVTMISPCALPDGALYELDHVQLSGKWRTFRFAFEMRRRDLSSYDVLHAHGDDYWLWGKRPVHVRTMHGSCFSEALRIKGPKERLRMVALGFSELLASLVADRTVCVSPPTRRWMPWVRTAIPAGVDTDVFVPAEGSRAARPTILFVGTYGQRKRGRLLMEVFDEQVLPAIPDAELWMVARDAPLARNVVVFGAVDQGELVECYQRAWVFCLPSSYEGLGIPYIEAMACGTPVVATRNPGSVFVLRGGRDGLLVDREELGTTLVKLLGDCERRAALAIEGRKRANQLGLSAAVDKYEDIYARLLERPARHALRMSH